MIMGTIIGLTDFGGNGLGVNLVLAAGLLLVTFLYWTWPERLPSSVPGPGRNIPYLGGLLDLMKNYERLPDYCIDANKLYSGTTWACPMPRVGSIKGACFFVTTPEGVKHVLKDNFDNYVKGNDTRNALGEFLGDGIFVADGPQWKFHRKVASHMFTNRLLRESARVACLHTARLITALSAACARSGGSGKSVAVDMQDMYFRLTIDIFTHIAFGVDLESVSRKDPHPFAVAFDEVQLHSEKRFYNPLWQLERLLQWSPGERAITRSVKVMNEFAKGVIAGRRRTLTALDSATASTATVATEAAEEEEEKEEEEASRLGPDLLSRFLEDAAKKDAADSKDGQGGDGKEKDAEARTGGSDKELRDIVLNFMIAGRDTTACALSWTLFELAKAPAAQAKLRAEFDAAVPQGVGGGDVSFEAISSLNYAHAVALEVAEKRAC